MQNNLDNTYYNAAHETPSINFNLKNVFVLLF